MSSLPLEPLMLALYALGAVILTVYTLGELHLLYFYLTRRRRLAGRTAPAAVPDDQLPMVTVQIPMYNERYVAEHVIDACAALDWPRDRLEIQVLDDSTDDAVAIARARVAHWQARGVAITHLHRTERRGFKAGALAAATRTARGAFIAVFDADFRPAPDFLRRVMPWFRDDRVGVVQTRWGHLNARYSILTWVQSVLLDMFFVIEQQARWAAGLFTRFNGSGGVWRAACMADAGGWTADTLAEDLDLVYRAQLKGWRAVYDGTVVAPAEIPVTMSDFKAQQYRWTKGKAQVIRKLAPAIWRARLPFLTKFHALFDLCNLAAYPGILLLSLFSVPLTWIVVQQPEYARYLVYVSFGLINLIIAPWFVLIVLRQQHARWGPVWRDFVRVFPPLVATAVGATIFQVTAIVDGLVRRDATFQKTAKFNITQRGEGWRGKAYSPRRVTPTTYLEGMLALLFVAALWLGLTLESFGALPFHFVLTCGYGYVFTRSVLRA